MFYRGIPAVLLAAVLTNTVSANDELLQPRDLDGNANTAEAYYDAQRNITWLANTNIGITETFGLQRGPFTANSLEVLASGEMRQEALDVYLSGMNQNVYLGQSNWRLPIAQSSGDSDCSVQSDGFSWGDGCSGVEVPALSLDLLARYGSVANSPFENLNSTDLWLGSRGINGRHKFQFGSVGTLFTFPASFDPVGRVWPVHDGDVGNSVMQAVCIDADGDGWGWDGSQSCLVSGSTSPVAPTSPTAPSTPTGAECIDSDGDGWGWDGRQSCRVGSSPMNPLPMTPGLPMPVSTCVDADGDGWGWDGTMSCRVETTMSESPTSIAECIDTDGDGWGWDGTSSCRI